MQNDNNNNNAVELAPGDHVADLQRKLQEAGIFFCIFKVIKLN